MTDVTFSQQFQLLTRPDYRYIVDSINNMMHRAGVISQIPYVKEWGIGNLIMRKKLIDAAKFRDATKKLAVGRMNMKQEGQKDAFQNILNAKDPESGEGLPLPEILVEAAVLVVAGRCRIHKTGPPRDQNVRDFKRKQLTTHRRLRHDLIRALSSPVLPLTQPRHLR